MSESEGSIPPEFLVNKEKEKPWTRVTVYFSTQEEAAAFVKEFWQTVQPGFIESNFKEYDNENDFFVQQLTSGDRTFISRTVIPDDKKRGAVYARIMGNNQILSKEAREFIRSKGDSITKTTSDI